MAGLLLAGRQQLECVCLLRSGVAVDDAVPQVVKLRSSVAGKVCVLSCVS